MNSTEKSSPAHGRGRDSVAGETGDGLLDVLRRRAPCKSRRVAEKEIIYREGEEAGSVYVILGGMVKLLVHLPNGKERIVRLQVAGDWLAIEALDGERIYEHTACAVSDVRIAQISSTALRALIDEDSELRAAMLKRGYDQLEKADKWITEFSTGSIKARLAHLIEYLGEIEDNEESDVVNLLTVNETADVLGVTPESVSRLLAEFKRSDVLVALSENDNWLYRIDKARLAEEQKE